MFKIMGGKGSKGIAKQERHEIIQQVRLTIQRGTTSNERANLANQFQRASSINIDEILSPLLKQHKSFTTAMKKGELVAVIKILTAGKVGVNEVLDRTGWKMSPLHMAAMLGKPEIMRALLGSPEIDVNPLNKDGDTPLLLAIKSSGIHGEAVSLQTVSILVEDRRCQIGRVNSVGATPLSIAVAKGFKQIVSVLVTCHRIRIYSAIDLAMAIKLAVIYDKDELVDLIFNEMNGHSKAEFVSMLEQNPELISLARHLQELDARRRPKKVSDPGQRQGQAQGQSSRQELPAVDYDDEDTENDHDTLTLSPPKKPEFLITISTTADTLRSKCTKDAAGADLRIGNIIEILSPDVIRKCNPRLGSEVDFIEGVANQRAFVHDIDTEGDMYIDVIEGPFAGHVHGRCVRFAEVGPTAKLNDGAAVAVGYYVRVMEEADQVKALARGHGGWKEDMRQCCGKTGRIRKIDKDGDVFVHFPNGQRHCFSPNALLVSSASDVEAKDINGDFIRKGSFARVTSNEHDFRLLQGEVCQEYDEGAAVAVMGKLVKVRKLRLFLQYTDALILIGPSSYYLNPKCLQVVMAPKDSAESELHVGDTVWVLSSKMVVKALQTTEYGNWIDKMDGLLGQAGLVIDIEVNPTDVSVSDRPVTRVQFPPPLGTYYLNPKILRKTREEEGPRNAGAGAGASPGENAKYGSSPSLKPPAGGSYLRNGSSPSITLTSSLSEDPGYGSTTDIVGGGGGKKYAGNRKGSSASILSSSSVYNDGLQIIARKDLEMKKKLGEGGFGCVTSGSWRGTDCAIKQIRPIVTSEIDYDDILKEARIQYGLKHPNIVQLYGISYESDLWMVMQLVNGMDLHTILFGRDSNGNKEKIAYNFKVKISVQTTNAILHLHEKGFLHNDIKPENIMVEKKTGNVLICDFGITRYLGQTDLRTYSQKYTDAFGGTLPYIAPECFQRDPIERRYLRPTFKSDVWALGAVLVELYTEKELFPSEKALYQCKIMNEYAGVKSMIRTIAEPTIRALLKRALDVAPESRPTAEDMNRIFFDIMKQQKC